MTAIFLRHQYLMISCSTEVNLNYTVNTAVDFENGRFGFATQGYVQAYIRNGLLSISVFLFVRA